MIWIRGRWNLSDPGTNTASTLKKFMLQRMLSGRIVIAFPGSESRRSHLALG